MLVKKGMFTDRELELAGRSVKLATDTYFTTEEMRCPVHVDIVPTVRVPDDNQVRLHILDGCPKGYERDVLTAAIAGAKTHFGDSVQVLELPPVRHARERIID
jgi:hypothetical protein